MKKLIAVLLASAAVFSISICAFADTVIDQTSQRTSAETALSVRILDKEPEAYKITIPSSLTLNKLDTQQDRYGGILNISCSIGHLTIGNKLKVDMTSKNFNNNFYLVNSDSNYGGSISYQIWKDHYFGSEQFNAADSGTGINIINASVSGNHSESLYIATDAISDSTNPVTFTDTLTFTASISQS